MTALHSPALSALSIPGTKLCRPRTTLPIKQGQQRLEALIARVGKERGVMVCASDKISDLLTKLNPYACFRIEAFDSAAAVELAVRTAQAVAAGNKREGAPGETPWSKVKFDRQIVAVAIVDKASEIISDDPHLKAIGERWGIKLTSVEDLPPPHPPSRNPQDLPEN